MFGLLNSSQIYGLHQAETNNNNNNNNNSNNHNNIICNRQTDKLSNSGGGMKISANFLEKFIKSEVIAGAALDLRNGYDAVKNLKNFHNQNNNFNNNSNTSSNLNGNYRHNSNTNYGCEIDNMTNKIKADTQNNGDDIVNNKKSTNSCSRKTGRKLNNEKDKENLNGNSNDVISELKSFDRQSGSSSNPSSSTVSSSSSTESPGAERKVPTTTTMDPMQRKKFIQMVTFLDHQNQRLQKELAKEKRRRAEELSRIIKSLLCFEAKLKVDKKVINQKLLEKDNEICRLVSLNRALMKQCNGNSLNDSNLGDEQECDVMEALQCLTCKKDFYGIESKDSWAQTGKEGRNMNDDQTTEHGSSSDDTLSSSFYGARRSIRYTSKRTFGTFRDYMRSRSMNIDDLNLDNSEENTSTISRDDSQNSYEKMNVFSRTIDRMHGVRRVSSFEGDLDSENDNNSRRIKSKNCSNSSGVDDDENMNSLEQEDDVFIPKGVGKTSHAGGRRMKGFLESSPQQAFETSTDDWYASASEPEETESVRTKPYGYNAVNPVLECVNQILLQQSMEECLNDSPTSLEGSEHNSNASSGATGGNAGSGNVSSTSSLSSGKENNNGTVGRKRVHFSTKNSMVHVPRDDDSSMPTQLGPSASVIAEQIKDNILNYESIYSNEYEPIGSEQNSSNLYVDMETKLGQEDRQVSEKPKQPPALPPKPANLMKFKRITKPTLNRSQSPQTDQSVIIKDDDKSVISEPDYCSISEVNMAVTSVKIVADVHKIPDDTSVVSKESVEDKKNAGILTPPKTYEIEEIFADIPKLPNVAAIIAPKTPTKMNSNENNNYVSPTLTPNSHHHSIYQQQQQRNDEQLKPKSPRQIKRKHVPNILAEINKRMNNSNASATISATSTPTSTPTKTSQSPKKVVNHPLASIIKLNPNSNIIPSSPSNSPPIVSDKLPLQAEFDWYNLDAEYGKSPNQPDVIQPSDSGIIEEINEFDVGENDSNLAHPHGVEYNLDEEFSLSSNQPDIIKENIFDQNLDDENANNANETENEQIRSMSPPTLNPTTPLTISDTFPIITDTTPCTKKVKTQNFDNFLDNSGLSSKPLPRQRKIYFAGPFV